MLLMQMIRLSMNPYWHTNLTYNPGNANSYRPIKNSDMTGACSGNYKDFSGNMGIVGTPVIDTLSGTIYVVSRSVTHAGAPCILFNTCMRWI